MILLILNFKVLFNVFLYFPSWPTNECDCPLFWRTTSSMGFPQLWQLLSGFPWKQLLLTPTWQTYTESCTFDFMKKISPAVSIWGPEDTILPDLECSCITSLLYFTVAGRYWKTCLHFCESLRWGHGQGQGQLRSLCPAFIVKARHFV